MDEIRAEIADMSYAELSRWLDRRVREDPFFARIPNAWKPARSPMERDGVREAGSFGIMFGDGARG